MMHGTAPFHVVVATTALWHTDVAIAGPFHTSKNPSGQDEQVEIVDNSEHADNALIFVCQQLADFGRSGNGEQHGQRDGDQCRNEPGILRIER